jgi:hypothetical protein
MDGRWRRLLVGAALVPCLWGGLAWADEVEDEVDDGSVQLKKVEPSIAAAKPAETTVTGAVHLEGHHLDVKLNTPCIPLCGPPANDGSEVYGHNMHRAGYPQSVACWAKPSETCAYIGYPVGGGCPCHRSGRMPNPECDGTWGWDYCGRCFKRNVFLLWWTKPKSQGGVGQYEPEGPNFVEQCHEKHHPENFCPNCGEHANETH